MHHKPRRLSKDRLTSAVAPYFNFEDASAPEVAQRQGPDPAKAIRQACKDWENAGNLIVRYTFGVTDENRYRDERGVLRATYRAVGERCDPLGLVLIGKPCNFMSIMDAARALGVDEFWIVGFMHSIDRLSVATIGKRLEDLLKSASYQVGREAGRKIAAEFIKDEKRAEIAA